MALDDTEELPYQWFALTRVLQRYALCELSLRVEVCALASSEVCNGARPNDGRAHGRPSAYCGLCDKWYCPRCGWERIHVCLRCHDFVGHLSGCRGPFHCTTCGREALSPWPPRGTSPSRKRL